MRHPLRGLARQGFWYTLSNVLVKLGGLVLLPLYASTQYLSVAGFGRWGVLEVTAQIAIVVLGLQLTSGLLRFYPESDRPERVLATTWWTTLGIALTAWSASAACISAWVPAERGRLYLLLGTYIAFEMLLAVPMTLLRVQGHALRYTLLSICKLGLLISLNLLFLVYLRRELTGLLEAFVVASGTALLAALLLTGPMQYLRPVFDRARASALLQFSAPLVMAGLASIVLNAGDRYVLELFSSDEELALYTMAAKFGSVVNMFGVQPLSLAFLPIFFRLAAHQREAVLQPLMRYLVVGLGLLVVGLSLFTEPVLHLLQADPYYRQSAVLVPWIALGFAALGLSIPLSGILGLFRRTGVASAWVLGATVFNIGLNFILVPRLDALGAAIATLAAYALLLAGRFFTADRLLPVPYAWPAVFGISSVTALVAFGGVLLPFPEGVLGFTARAGLVVLWGSIILLARWITWADVRTVWRELHASRKEAVTR